jgi:membrane fusion protein (multidrug efflux system)
MSRKIVLVIVLIAIAFSGLGIFGYYWYQGSHYVSTDDALLCGNQIAVSSEIIGRIAIMTVAEGDKVTKGQILAKLDDALLMAQVNQAKANKDYATQNVILAKVKLDQAQSDFNRATILFQDKVITQEQDDHQKHTLASAQAGLDIALSQEKLATAQISTLETSLAHATIVSPVDGVVAKKWAMPGNVIQPAQSIYTLYDLPNIWIQANFKESQINT